MIMLVSIFTKINTKWKNVNDESLFKYFNYLNSDIWKSLLGNNKDQKIEKKKSKKVAQCENECINYQINRKNIWSFEADNFWMLVHFREVDIFRGFCFCH